MEWIASHPNRWGTRVLAIVDSQVTVGAFSKGRSSKAILNGVARRLGSLLLATGIKVYWRYIRTNRNHADGPSRGQAMGIAEKAPPIRCREPLDGQSLPDFFYQNTPG